MINVNRKKRFFIISVALVLSIMLFASFVLAGCDLTRKIKGPEAKFPGKISKSQKLSFKMDVSYKKGDVITEIAMLCYRAKNEAGEDEYAYVYSYVGSAYQSYKNIYADGKLYEMVNVTQNAGSYYVKDNVSVDDDGNILYHITQKILLTSVVAFISKAKKETLREESVYRYDVSISGKNVSLWYNSEALVQIYVAFENDGGETEEYTIALSDYIFDQDLPEEAFKRPNAYGIYIQSPISFEEWTSILTSFAQKLG